MREHSQFFGDGEYKFRLRIKEIRELQTNTGTGLGEICKGIIGGWPDYYHVYELIRLALIGGGTTPAQAKKLVDMYVDDAPLANLSDDFGPIMTARRIVDVLWFGPESLESLVSEGEARSGGDEGGTQASMSPPSTGKAPASDGRRGT